MSTQWHGEVAFRAVQEAAAKGLMAAAVAFENQHRRRISTPNPPPYLNSSKPGQYMRLRTGAGMKALTHQPATVAEVIKTGEVRVGFRAGDGDHMLILELHRQRLGLEQTLADMRGKLAQIATAEFRK